MLEGLISSLPLAQSGGSGNFLVTPEIGLMIWTLIAFGASVAILRKLAYPKIQENLDKRRIAIEESIDASVRTKEEADKLLEEYRARLKEAREQADDIITRSRRAAESIQDDAKVDAKKYREELMESTRRDIENETRRALDEIRKEVADLTVIATEKVTRKTLTDEDQRRLIDEALSEVDFSALAGPEEKKGE
jgi:F-type H+-transporting ATPase subunit b